MANSKWNIDNIPNQSNRVVIITGASSGLGKEATRVMASKNARVIMAVRNSEKAKSVMAEIKNAQPDANIEIQKLDLGSLDSHARDGQDIVLQACFCQELQEQEELMSEQGQGSLS